MDENEQVDMMDMVCVTESAPRRKIVLAVRWDIPLDAGVRAFVATCAYTRGWPVQPNAP